MSTQYVYGFLLSLALSLVLMPILIRLAAQLRLVDAPEGDARKLHSTVMPRSGGLGIIVAAAIALLVILPLDESLLSFFPGCLIIIGFGLIDDVVELKPWQKLVGQALGVSAAMAYGMVIKDVPFLDSCPIWFGYTLTFVFVMGVINGVNFSDGMDGLAAGTTLMALVLIFILAAESNDTLVCAIALTICASLVGFLRFNTYPATIFMGDAGSQFLGFVVAWLAITVSQSEASPMTTLMPLLILGIPVMDILQVVPVRIKKKLPLPGPDKEHFHHQIAKLGFHQYEVVAIIYVLQAALLTGAYLLRFASDELVFGYYAFYVVTSLSVLYAANVYGWKHIVAPADTAQKSRDRIMWRLQALHRYSGKFYGVVIVLFFVTAAMMSTALPDNLVYVALVCALGLVGVKLLSGNQWPLILSRLATYTATGFLVYGLTLSIHSEGANWLIDGVFIVLAVLLLVSIRTAPGKFSWLTKQDLLVVFFLVILVSQLPLEMARDINTIELVFRTFVLLYACEYVMAQSERARGWLTGSAIVALFLLGLNL